MGRGVEADELELQLLCCSAGAAGLQPAAAVCSTCLASAALQARSSTVPALQASDLLQAAAHRIVRLLVRPCTAAAAAFLACWKWSCRQSKHTAGHSTY